jgi:hypothetical protein
LLLILLPPVAAVLPAEKGNETLVKWGLLPCCRFSGLLSINRAFPASLGGEGMVRSVYYNCQGFKNECPFFVQ